MTGDELTGRTPGDAPPDDIQALTQEIERTREELGETVEALAAKADVTARGTRRPRWPGVCPARLAR